MTARLSVRVTLALARRFHGRTQKKATCFGATKVKLIIIFAITMKHTRTDLELRHRFIEDTALPIQVIQSPYFEDRLSLFNKEFGAKEKYEKYISFVKENYGDDTHKFLEEYFAIRSRIIDDRANSVAFKAFNEDKEITSLFKDFKPVIGNVNPYTQEQVKEGNNCFLTFDMKKANFQALRKINPEIVLNAENYHDFIMNYADEKWEWIADSKRTRQIIFGQLNPKRTMQVEKVFIGQLVEVLSKYESIAKYFTLFSMNSDELIYKLNAGEDFNNAIDAVSNELYENALNKKGIFTQTGIHYRAEFFKLNCHMFKSHNTDRHTQVYVKDFILNGTKEYKCADVKYFPQTYKLINNLEIKDTDLVFFHDNMELAKFLYPLEKV